ncbi:hypothetical protein Hanom_Chr00s000003g01604431 [Helianthus anomalus]
MLVLNCRRCRLHLNLTSFVLNVSKSCMLCSLAITQSDFFFLNMVMCFAHRVFLSFHIL